MTIQTLMIKAHAEAKLDHKRNSFMTYRQCLSNAMRGLWAVKNGFTGEL